MTLVRQLHETLYRLNVGVDLVFPQSTTFEDYDVLLVPALYVASDELLGRLVDFVRRGGHLLLTFKSGFADEHSHIRWSRAPGPLARGCRLLLPGDILGRAGLTGPDQDLPPLVRLRQGVGREGKRLRYYLNYSRAPQSFSYPHASGTDLLTGKTIQKSQPVSLEPWDVIIVEEG